MRYSEEILAYIETAGSLSVREAKTIGISRMSLQRLMEAGKLIRPTRGLYMLANADISTNQTLVEVASRVPSGVFCLLTALRFHGLTTQVPFDVWLAIRAHTAYPRMSYPVLRIIQIKEYLFEEGIDEHTISGVKLRIYAPARSVADAFKFRNSIGKDVAIEALHEYRRKFRETAKLWNYAKLLRVSRVMLPYLESVP